MSHDSLVRSQLGRIVRPTLGLDETTRHSTLFAETLTSHLKRSYESLTPAATFDNRFGQTEGVVPHLAERQVHLNALRETALRRPFTTLQVVLNPGNRVIGTPYDTQWSAGSGVFSQWTAKDDGELLTMSTDGFSASGVGVFLESSVPLAAAVTAVGVHDFNWFSVTNNWNVRSRGGLGALVYEVGNSTPLAFRESTAWNVVGAMQFQGSSGGGRLEDAVAGTTVFGDIALQPLLFDMQPGRRYVFWFWLWQVFRPGGDDGFLAFHKARVMFMSSSAGPPVIIH